MKRASLLQILGSFSLFVCFSSLGLFVACGGDDDAGEEVSTPVIYSDWPAARDLNPAAASFPNWAFGMRIWPFDILTPETTHAEIDSRLDAAVQADADTVIFYIESEHMYGTFVDEAGFAGILPSIEHLTAGAAARSLRSIVYVNGLEVMTRGAFDAHCNPTGATTMASAHPDWLQRDLDGEAIVFGCQDQDWLEPDWEDAWISPFSGYRDLFITRIGQLADAGVDAVYIDATFLPGYQPDEDDPVWGSTDQAFEDAFFQATGLDLPRSEDFDDPAFRAFLAFRHTALAGYLRDLADAAWSRGVVPFWESSTNDTPENTLLGNETSVTGRQGLGYSPEIEPEGEYLAAFRMAKAARELNLERPMIYLGWPESAAAARLELALALSHSNTYYPTADIDLPEDAFPLMRRLETVLERRIPYAGRVAVIYSARNQDNTFWDESFFGAYEEATEHLISRHIPFRIAALEYLPDDGLDNIDTVILPGIQAVSDEEAAILGSCRVIPVGDGTGTRDETWALRSQPVTFADTAGLDGVFAALPFDIAASEDAFIEYYGDRDGEARIYLFVVSPRSGGRIVLGAREGGSGSLSVTVYGLDRETTDLFGPEIIINADSPLLVLDVRDGG